MKQCECGKSCRSEAGYRAHKRFCKFEGIQEQPEVGQGLPEVKIEFNEPETLGPFKVGDMVQHIVHGWKFPVAAVQDGQVGQAVQSRAAKEGKYKWFRATELKHYKKDNG